MPNSSIRAGLSPKPYRTKHKNLTKKSTTEARTIPYISPEGSLLTLVLRVPVDYNYSIMYTKEPLITKAFAVTQVWLMPRPRTLLGFGLTLSCLHV